MELCSILCGRLDGRDSWGKMDTCICMAESLHGSSETITTLLIGYTPIQNIFGAKKSKINFLKKVSWRLLFCIFQPKIITPITSMLDRRLHPLLAYLKSLTLKPKIFSYPRS